MHTMRLTYVFMKSRISITMDPKVQRDSQRLAKARGTTVSGLVESLLSRQVKAASGSQVDQLIGSAEVRESGGEQDERFAHLRRKYLSS